MSPPRIKSYFSWPVWVVYSLLFLLAVPWYWDADSRATLAGFPLWVVVSVFASFLISCFTAWLFLKCWPVEEEEEGSE